MIITNDGERYRPSDSYVPLKILRDKRMKESELRGIQKNYSGHRYVPVVFFPKRETIPSVKQTDGYKVSHKRS